MCVPSYVMLLGRTEQELHAQSCRRPVLLIKLMRELGSRRRSVLPKRQTQDWNPGLLAPKHLPVSTSGAALVLGSEAKVGGG